MANFRCRQFDVANWPHEASKIVHEQVVSVLGTKQRCNVMLTGGRSAKLLYVSWAGLPGFEELKNVHFYFGDERCVPPEDNESNYGMAMKTLFENGIPTGCIVERMIGESDDCGGSAFNYDEKLPGKIDVMLLGVGEDGHIASLFPGSRALEEKHRRVVAVTGPKKPFSRLTITPLVLANTDAIFVLATGPEKARVYARVLRDEDENERLPAHLVSNATWLLDSVFEHSGTMN